MGYQRIPFCKINWDEEDIKALSEVIRSGEDWAIGSKVEEFEKTIADYTGKKYAVAFNSGTSALHATMLALEIEGEVIVPSFTFAATCNAPLFVGAKPVFADIEKETYGIDPNDVLNKITDRTSAIIAVHYAGQLCQIKELKAIAEDYGLFLIEDAAEALGAGAGKWGDVAIFSFCQNKIITTGEGGIAITNHEAIFKKLKRIRSHGKEEYDIVQLGYNWRMPNINAALGLSQFQKLEENIKKRRENVKYLLKEVKENHTYQMCSILVEDRDKIKNYLNEQGVEARIYFTPVHLSSFYKSFGHYEGELPMTEEISKKILTLPMYPNLTKQEMDYIKNLIWKKTS